MIRAVLAALVVLVAAAASAECIDETAAWSKPYSQGDIQMVTYYVWQQGPPAPRTKPPLLAVVFRSGEYHLHQDVPTSVAQRFNSVSSADTTYTTMVKMRFHQLLLNHDLCPLRNDTGSYLLGSTP